jgi:phenylacetic acid degradation operon negative regulatory protein
MDGTTLRGVAGTALPRERILDVYGAFGRRVGGWIAIADLIALLGPMGLDAQSLRSATSRMKRSGLLSASRQDGTAGYALTTAAMELLADGDRRIFHPLVEQTKRGWVLAVFSVPESQRDSRYLIRSRLAGLGFGTVASGVMVAPRAMAPEARHMLQRRRLHQFVHLWESELIDAAEARSMVASAWDLKDIASSYRHFIRHAGATVKQAKKSRAPDGEWAFGAYIDVLAEWRPLPYLDPDLPLDLLPATWPARTARALFLDIVGLLEVHAFEHFLAVTGASTRIANG